VHGYGNEFSGSIIIREDFFSKNMRLKDSVPYGLLSFAYEVNLIMSSVSRMHSVRWQDGKLWLGKDPEGNDLGVILLSQNLCGGTEENRGSTQSLTDILA
jgi:hypothetical protein